MAKKKKGSSMIFVLIVFGVIAVLGVSILMATYVGYTVRIKENNKVKALYSAESGLDQAYLRLCSQVDIGISKGTEAVKSSGSSLTIKKENDDFKKGYIEYIVDNLEGEVTDKYEISTGYADIICTLVDKDDAEGKITKNYNDKTAVLISSFKGDDGTYRQVKVSYNLSLPEDVVGLAQTNGSITPISSFSMATDQNMLIKNVGTVDNNLNIYGDVWIKGERSTQEQISTNPLINKYKGGLQMDAGNATFNNSIITASNILITKGNLFSGNGDGEGARALAENIYLGSLEDEDREVNDSSFYGQDLYLANDLVIGGTDCIVSAKNLYAFNDINSDKSKDNGKAARESSSIIINSLKWPNNKGKINIDGSAYIMGLAYIKTANEPYQTGESVSYRGNYSAYTKNADDGLKEDGQYTYLDPMVLLTGDSKGNELDSKGKEDRFIKYSEKADQRLRVLGISLPQKTYTAGAYISNGKVESSKILGDDIYNKLDEFKKEYINSVNYMGSGEGNTAKINEEFLKNPVNTVERQINWDGVEKLISARGNIIENDDVVFVLNMDESKNIKIDDNKIKLGNKESILKDKVRYIIVTKGSVELYDQSSDYNGVIMAEKNISLYKNKGKAGINGGVRSSYEEAHDDTKSVLNMIFSNGDPIITENAVSSSDIIKKEKWSIVK